MRFRAIRNGFLVCGSLVLMGQACTTPSGEQSLTFLRTVIEAGTLDTLGPAGEAVTVLQNLPDATKAGLISYINRRLQDAAIDGDFDRIDWLQANQSCLAADDCARLRQLERERARRTPVFEPEAGAGGGGDGGGGD